MSQIGGKQRSNPLKKVTCQWRLPAYFSLGLLFISSSLEWKGTSSVNPPVPSARPLRIYVADIPEKFNLELVHDSTREGCQSTDYALDLFSIPVGKFVNRSYPGGGTKSAYHGLEIYLHYQILHSPLRVHDVEESDIVFVPLYPALAVYDNGPSGLGPCTASVGKARSVLDEFFQQINTFLPSFGRKPHWMPLATLELEHMDGCGGWGSQMLCKYNETAQFVFTVPEIAATGVALPAISVFRSAAPQHENVVAVPYFGHFHMPQVTAPLNESETKVNFAECARCAAKSILDMQKKNSVHTVYFSADIDLDGLPWSKSISYGNNSEAQQGLKVKQSMIPNLKTWRDIPTPRGSDYDLSTIGMLDRVIAMTSDFFVSGPPTCARGGSYVKSIEEWRLAQLEINETSRMPPSKHIKNGNEKWKCGAHENPAH